MNKITVRVPATSANVGPGFDSAGFAVSIYNTLTFTLVGDGVLITGDEPRYCTKQNLAYTSFLACLKAAGKDAPRGLHLHIDANIPATRGLGSSAAMVVGGVVAANELCGCNFSKQQILDLVTSIEGHPDNVAPALFGGLTVSFVSSGSVNSVRYNISDKFKFTALIPDFRLSTSKARKALPAQVPLSDAVFNISRAAVLYKSLEIGDEAAVEKALDDRLHQDYRKNLIEDYDSVRQAAFESGAIGFYLSGAGPTLMCISTEDICARLKKRVPCASTAMWEIKPLKIEQNGIMIL